MLPSFLCSTYKQYKEDTKYVTEWLAQNAKFRGYVFSTPTTSAPKLVPIKKIKNKKKALEAEQARQSQAKPYLVSTKELLALAQYVAKCDKPPIVIPSSIISTVRRTIKARQYSSDYYYTVDPSSNGNVGHVHFIQTFQTILELLSSVVPPTPRPRSPLSSSDLSTTKTYNSGTRSPIQGAIGRHEDLSSVDGGTLASDFSATNLEDCDLATLESSKPISQTLQNDKKAPRFGLELMPQDEKLNFATTCLFRDIRNIARHITSLWERYAEGKADLVAVTVASVCGINLITRFEDDFMEEFPEIKDMQELLLMFYYGEVFGQELEDLINTNIEYADDIEKLKRAEYCFFPMFRRMARFVTSYRDDPTVPTYVPLPENSFDTTTPRTHATTNWEFKRIRRGRNKEGMVLDPLLRALRSFWLRGGKLLLWHIVAGQCCLEAMHATMSVPHKALDEVRAFCRGVKGSVSKISGSTDKNFNTLQKAATKNINEVLVEDTISRFIAENRALDDPAPPPAFCFISKNPMLCGMYAFSLMEDLHRIIVFVVRKPAVIFSVAHLVSAVQQEGTCSASWPELERMIQIQGEEFVFIGKRPKTAEQYSSRYKLLRGLSAVELASNRRSTRRVRSTRKPRTLKEDLPTSSLLGKWWGPNNEDTNLAHVEKLLNEYFEGIPKEEALTLASASQRQAIPEGTPFEIAGVRRRQAQNAGRKIRDKLLRTKSLTPIEFLGALECSMTHETPMLKYDYLELHRQCLRLLHRIATRMNDLLSAGYGPDWLGKSEKEEDEHVVAALILDAGAEGSKLAKQFFKARELQRGGGQSRFLYEAGHIVEEFLEELAKQRKEDSIGEYDEAEYSKEESPE